ncbi:MAG TPA: hypothetical protein VF134_08490 [Candidatus Dormibacteraeota bacterium]
MRLYTAVQLFEVAVFGAVLGYGVLAHRPSIAILGGGLLAGKAILNILAPEGGSVLRRSIIGYAIGAIYVVVGVVLVHLR